MSKSECGAKNRARCRVHGAGLPAVSFVYPAKAAKHLADSKKQLEEASSIEEMFEAQQLHAYDKKVYDATYVGEQELLKKIRGGYQMPKPTFSEKVELEKRLAEGREYRKELIENTPALKEREETFERVTTEEGTQSYIPKSQADYQNMLDEIGNVSYGTPIAVKLKDGSIIYDGAGDSLNYSVKRKADGSASRFTKMMLPVAFIKKFKNEPISQATLSLQHNNISVPLPEVAEVHVLSKKPEISSLVHSQAKESSKSQKPAPRAIVGKEYYYDFVGSQKDWKTSKGAAVPYYTPASENVVFEPIDAVSIHEIDVA